MKIRIYQINSDRDENRMMFLSHDRLERFQGSPEVDSKIYDKVYDKEVDCSNLEEVYTLLNIDHPEDYRGRSLSVSDAVADRCTGGEDHAPAPGDLVQIPTLHKEVGGLLRFGLGDAAYIPHFGRQKE